MNGQTMIVFCDVDGTISDHEHRAHHVLQKPRDYKAYYQGMTHDPPIREAQKALSKMMASTGPCFHFLTGRPEQYRPLTAEWLKQHFGADCVLLGDLSDKPRLIMRPDNDYRPAVMFKEQMIKSIIGEGMDPLSKLSPLIFFIDDDLRNEAMYKKYGLFLKAPECWDFLS